ncbi:2-C-methyl-D-erythritol 4-phosphate cytidylyltransferase [Demequina sp. B12]|uniref:IspD/TarI family cytidylyltransferase n=1 Tax=Demequina sp. B12 TaxID=2992757 RepID=UPI00237A2814|nr:IspD/TarI family cytidylyltransferase [Demequina sp. B12]MDE0572229.1 2-C-methyl-D-erythritol 4-phosphate cytidylyltransferase [Demequina sp. B12]
MISLLLLNGGIGARAKTAGPKQFVKINGVPILVYSLKEADEVEAITEIVVNYPAGHLDTVEQLVRDYAIATPVKFVEAGTTRQESVAKLLDAADNDTVMIHESARPLVTAQDFAALANSEHANVGFMREISFTVAPVDPDTQRVTGSLERARLRNVQLPQKFAAADLRKGHEFAIAEGRTFTEDATMCADAGIDVFFIEGDESNLKVTTPGDVRLATHLFRTRGEDDE